MKNTMQKVMWAIAAAIFCILVVHTPAQAMMTEDQADGKSIYRIQNGEYDRDDDDRWKTGNIYL